MAGFVVVITALVLQVESAEIVSSAQEYVGRPYVYGGEGPSGVDCSGLVLAVFGEHGMALPRTAEDQARVGQAVALAEIVAGDLLFFTHVPGSARVQHVGLAIDDRHMIHASTSRRAVVVDAFDSRHYRERFLFARRLLDPPPAPVASSETEARPAEAEAAPAKTRSSGGKLTAKPAAGAASRKPAAAEGSGGKATAGAKAAVKAAPGARGGAKAVRGAKAAVKPAPGAKAKAKAARGAKAAVKPAPGAKAKAKAAQGAKTAVKAAPDAAKPAKAEPLAKGAGGATSRAKSAPGS